MRGLSNDIRKRIVATYRRGDCTYEDVAKRFQVGRATVSRLLRRYREDKTVTPRPHGGGRRRLLSGADEKRLEKYVLANPDWTEHEYASKLTAELGRELNRLVVGRSIRRMGYRVKKSPSSPAKETAPTSQKSDASSSTQYRRSRVRVWFLWTKPASTRR